MKYILLILLSLSQLSHGVDNPEAPNFVAEFESRIKLKENYIEKTAQTTIEYIEGYGEIYSALDKELNNAYGNLIKKLSDHEKGLLKKSQRQWIKYRDAEFDFIADTITRAKFGSSSVMTVGSRRNAVLKARVIQLYRYLNKHS
jgi:uncharacterized protein YecT (DUF1311 family)